MLKIQKPLQTKCLRYFPGAGNSFFERTDGKYRFFCKQISPQELLHMTMVPPEVVLMETGGGSILSGEGRIRMELINQLFNRLCLYVSGRFTYQDSVFVTRLLRQAGVRQTEVFFRNLYIYWEETARIVELTRRYAKNGAFLRRLLKETEQDEALESGNQKVSGSGLEYAIYNRLGTVATTGILEAYAGVSASVAHSRYLREWVGLAASLKNAAMLRLEEARRRAGGRSAHMVCADTFYLRRTWKETGQITSGEAEASLAASVLLFLAQRIPAYGGKAYAMRWQDYSHILYQAARPVLEWIDAGKGQNKAQRLPEQNGISTTLLREAELLRYFETAFGPYGEPGQTTQTVRLWDSRLKWRDMGQVRTDRQRKRPEAGEVHSIRRQDQSKKRPPEQETGLSVRSGGTQERPVRLREAVFALWNIWDMQEKDTGTDIESTGGYLTWPEQEAAGIGEISRDMLRGLGEGCGPEALQAEGMTDAEYTGHAEPEKEAAVREMQAWRHFLDQVNERNLQMKKLVESCRGGAEEIHDTILPDRKGTQRDALHFLEHPEAVPEAVEARKGLAGQKPSACEAALLQRDSKLYEEYQNIRRRMEQAGETEPERQQEMMRTLHAVLEEAGQEPEGGTGLQWADCSPDFGQTGKEMREKNGDRNKEEESRKMDGQMFREIRQFTEAQWSGMQKEPVRMGRENDRIALSYAAWQAEGKTAAGQERIVDPLSAAKAAVRDLWAEQTGVRSGRQRQNPAPAAELFYNRQAAVWEEELQAQLYQIKQAVSSQRTVSAEKQKNAAVQRPVSGDISVHNQTYELKTRNISGMTLSSQISQITEQVYQKLERRLQDERKRRGY